MIDERDLRPMKLSEMILEGVFFIKKSDGYHYAKVHKDEFAKDPEGIRQALRNLDGMMFVRISKPFQAFQ